MSREPDRPDRLLALVAWMIAIGATIAAAFTLAHVIPQVLAPLMALAALPHEPDIPRLVVSSSPMALQALASCIGLTAAAMALHVRAMGAGWLALRRGPRARGILPLTPLSAAVFSIGWFTSLCVFITEVLGAVFVPIQPGFAIVAALGTFLLGALAWALEHRPFVVVDGLAGLRSMRSPRQLDEPQKQNSSGTQTATSPKSQQPRKSAQPASLSQTFTQKLP